MGLERTFYNVSEGVGIVEVCAVVFQPVSDCPVSFSFDVILSTIDGTAGNKGNPRIIKTYCECIFLNM